MEDIIEQAKEGLVGDNGFGYDNTQDQEDYGTYSNYLTLIEDGGLSEDEVMKMMKLNQKTVNNLIERFEIEDLDGE